MEWRAQCEKEGPSSAHQVCASGLPERWHGRQLTGTTERTEWTPSSAPASRNATGTQTHIALLFPQGFSRGKKRPTMPMCAPGRPKWEPTLVGGWAILDLHRRSALNERKLFLEWRGATSRLSVNVKNKTESNKLIAACDHCRTSHGFKNSQVLRTINL